MSKIINKIITILIIFLSFYISLSFIGYNENNINNNKNEFYRFYRRYEVNKFIECCYDTEMIDEIYNIYNLNIRNYNITKKIIDNCIKYKVPVNIAIAIIGVESMYKPYATNYNSNSMDIGLFQLNTITYKNYKYYELYNVELNIELGIKHLKEEIDYYNNNIELAIISYNAGRYKINCDKLSKKNIEYLKKVLELEMNYDILFNDLLNKINGGY